MARNRMSDVDYAVLSVLISEPAHGYAIKKTIEERTEGGWKPSLPTVYDSLYRLFDDGLIERAEEKIVRGRVRRSYRVTGLGERAVRHNDDLRRQLRRPIRSQLEGANP